MQKTRDARAKLLLLFCAHLNLLLFAFLVAVALVVAQAPYYHEIMLIGPNGVHLCL